MSLPFQNLANEVFRTEIEPNYNPEGVAPLRKTHLTDELIRFWEERTKHALPNSYSYIYGYNPHRILCAKNLNLLYGNLKSEFITYPSAIEEDVRQKSEGGSEKKDDGLLVENYLAAIIEEQRFFSAYVIRRTVVDIFFKRWEFFMERQYSDKGYLEPKYVMYMDITIRDHKGAFWHGYQIIEPIVGIGGQFDLLYYCNVILTRESSKVPFSYRIEHRGAGLGDDAKEEVQLMNEILRQKLHKGIIDETGFSGPELQIYRYYISGLERAQIDDLHGIKGDNQNRITNGANKKMRKAFPVLMGNYFNGQQFVREDLAESNNKTMKSDLNPKVMASILSSIGLIRPPRPGIKAATSSADD